MCTESTGSDAEWTGQRYAELCRERQTQYQTAARFRQNWYASREAYSSDAQAVFRPAGTEGLYVAAESFTDGRDVHSFIALEALGRQDQDAAVIAELRAAALALLPCVENPAQLLGELNQLWGDSPAEPYIAAWAARYMLTQNRLLWSSAGWSTMLIQNPAGHWESPSDFGPLLGLLTATPYKALEITWSAETTLLLGSLSFTSADKFHLKSWLNQQPRLSPRALMVALTEAWHRLESPTATLPFVWVIQPAPFRTVPNSQATVMSLSR